MTEINIDPRLHLLWAKAGSGSAGYHPLLYHLIDVTQVVLSIWNNSLPASSRKYFSDLLDLDETSTGKLLAFWAGLHDLGKAGPGFQAKIDLQTIKQKQAGFDFPPIQFKPAPHGFLTTWALREYLPLLQKMSIQDACLVAQAVGGHHGTWPSIEQISPTNLTRSDKGGPAWRDSRLALVQALFQLIQPPVLVRLPEEINDRHGLLTAFSGFISFADWIGSMDEIFPYSPTILDAQEYLDSSHNQAEQALIKLGWNNWQPLKEKSSFEAIFPFPPNEIQQQAASLFSDLQLPAMVILETPTGSGKTEAALYLADAWTQNSQSRGLYVAMPTQATSNQMHERISNFLARRYPGQQINFPLVHGGAILAANNEKAQPRSVMDQEDQPQVGSIRAESWFLPRKRTFLAPFGVGTVDQAFLSILQTRHFFVRLFGLSQKIIVFDEVHAYDTYMSELFQRLLRWLKLLGSSVIILSATLPRETRRALVQAWQGDATKQIEEAPYPRMTVVSQEAKSIRLPAPKTQPITLEWVDPAPAAIIRQLQISLQDGGCAAILCNRVSRAQEIFTALQEAAIVQPQNLFLFHARFPFAWRTEIEQAVLNRFKKGGQRPEKAIVVATQVIEQSLDLDFDLMVSDLAPIDLLLQRAGRLHRHSQVQRPKLLRAARLLLASPDQHGAIPDFGKDKYIYDEYILLLSWICLRNRQNLDLPSETESLIEAVYGELADLSNIEQDLFEYLRSTERKMKQEQEKERNQARGRLVPAPDYEALLFAPQHNLEEEDPSIHQAFQALTRLAEPTVSVACLFSHADGKYYTEPDGGQMIDLNMSPDTGQVIELLRHSLSIQRKEIVKYFAGLASPPAWNKSAALSHHYPLIFDQAGRWQLPGKKTCLKLDRKLGLQIIEEDK